MNNNYFYYLFDTNKDLITQGHPLANSLRDSPAFMTWWDSLTPTQRRGLEDHADFLFSILERWKFECLKSSSLTLPTLQSVVQCLRTSASSSQATESQTQPSGKSNSATPPSVKS